MKIDFSPEADCTTANVLFLIRGFCCQIRRYALDDYGYTVLYSTNDIILKDTYVDDTTGITGIEYYELDENNQRSDELKRMSFDDFDSSAVEGAELYVY